MKKWSLALTLSVVLWATTASAALVTYTSEAAWKAAVGSFVKESFDNSGLASTTGVVTSAGQIDQNEWHDRVTLSGGESTTFRYTRATMNGAGGDWDTSPLLEGQALRITLNLTGGGTQFVGQIGPIDGFFGWTSDAAFDSFTIKAGNHAGVAETFELDDLLMTPTSGAVTPTVEPATLALVGTGLVGFRFIRRKLPFQS